MAAILSLATRPGPAEDGHRKARYRAVGITVAVVGMMGTVAAAIGNFVAAGGIDAENSYAKTLAWTFGLTTFSFGTMKFGIAIILMGIIVRLWFRVDALKHSLGRLHGHADEAPTARGAISTPYGAATVTDEPPKLLPIHRMARAMWRPMLAMGVMLVAAGLVSSFVWAGQTPGTESFRQAAAFTQGIQFLGEALLLSGIAFLLGTILAGLREGGGEVQSSLGLPVTTLKMSRNAKAFVALMMVGLMIGIAQFVGYLVAIGAADDPASFSSYLNWLGPFRELSLGLILAGIVLSLVAISSVLAFQFDRVKSIIRNGY